MKRKIETWEKVSSFAHSNDVWIAKLECDHEIRLNEEPSNSQQQYLECDECENDPETKQAA